MLWARKVPDGEGEPRWLVYNLLLCLVMADSLGQSKGQIITYLQKSEGRNRHEGPGTWSELNGFKKSPVIYLPAVCISNYIYFIVLKELINLHPKLKF